VDNKKYSFTVDHVKGSPENPMNREECIQKFMRCARYMEYPIEEKTLLGMIENILELEALDDITEIVAPAAFVFMDPRIT
jgi:hypothetical protein